METPKELKVDSLTDVDRLITKHTLAHYTETGNGPVCKNCGALVLFVHAYISVHTTLFSNCAGSGSVKQIDMPYCPNCEITPSDRGCIHLDDLV